MPGVPVMAVYYGEYALIEQGRQLDSCWVRIKANYYYLNAVTAFVD